MPEPPFGQTGGLSSTANLAYGLRASNERLRPQPSRPAPAAAPPAAAVVEEASTIIQAAARSRGVRRDAERSEKWLGDLTRSSAKLDAKALGELGDGKRSIPGPLLGVAGRTQFARAAEEKIAAARAKTLAESNPGRSARKARSGPGGTGIGLRGAVGAVRAANVLVDAPDRSLPAQHRAAQAACALWSWTGSSQGAPSTGVSTSATMGQTTTTARSSRRVGA